MIALIKIANLPVPSSPGSVDFAGDCERPLKDVLGSPIPPKRVEAFAGGGNLSRRKNAQDKRQKDDAVR